MPRMSSHRIHTLTVAIRAVLWPESIWVGVNAAYRLGEL